MKFSRWFLLLCAALFLIAYSCRKQKDILLASDPPDNVDTIPPVDSIPTTDSIPSDTVTNPAQDSVFYSLEARNIDIVANVGGFYEALPYDYDSIQTTYPLLIFLHGGGEVGNGKDELDLILHNGLAKRISDRTFPPFFTVEGAKYSFVALFPQFKKWPASSEVEAVINYAIAHYRVDQHRIYLAGLSMGGGATWDYAALHGSQLAAMVTICGASKPNASAAEKIARTNVPAWAFHNKEDDTVPVSYTEDYTQLINSFNPTYPVRMTIWPVRAHDAWTQATDPEYREEGRNMYEWMLQYSR